MVWCGGLRRTQVQPQDLELLFSVLFVLYLVFGNLLSFFFCFVVLWFFSYYIAEFQVSANRAGVRVHHTHVGSSV